jgi:hypothetical protein
VTEPPYPAAIRESYDTVAAAYLVDLRRREVGQQFLAQLCGAPVMAAGKKIEATYQ